MLRTAGGESAIGPQRFRDRHRRARHVPLLGGYLVRFCWRAELPTPPLKVTNRLGKTLESRSNGRKIRLQFRRPEWIVRRTRSVRRRERQPVRRVARQIDVVGAIHDRAAHIEKQRAACRVQPDRTVTERVGRRAVSVRVLARVDLAPVVRVVRVVVPLVKGQRRHLPIDAGVRRAAQLGITSRERRRGAGHASQQLVIICVGIRGTLEQRQQVDFARAATDAPRRKCCLAKSRPRCRRCAFPNSFVWTL